MEDYLKKDYGKILKSAGLEARRWMKNTDSSVSRVYDRNIEELPVTVDLYGEYARIVDFSEGGLSDEDRVEIEDLTSRFLYVEKSKVIYSYRKKREGREQHEKCDESLLVTVKENSILFECELKKYADTGLFLDMAGARALVKEMAFNQRVLNLFCYTSSFSVYAASGQAESVTSVDLSNVYSEWSRKNLVNNGFLDENKYRVVTEDARIFLREAGEKKEIYDLVIFDPPAFSNSHKAEEFDVQKDYIEFLSLIYSILSDDGVVLFSENLQGFRFDKNRVMTMYEAEEITSSLYALNFSHKRKSCRIWALKKISEKKRERKERKMSEKLERFDLDIEDELQDKKRAKKETRALTFEDSDGGDLNKKRYEERSSRYSDKRESSSRYSDRNRKYSNNWDSRTYSSNKDRRDSYSDRDNSSRYSDRDRRDRYSDRDNNSRYSDRNRGSRYSDRDRRDRYSDRDNNSRYSGRDGSSRYSERDYTDRKREYRGNDSRDRGNWSKRGEHTSFERREADGRRSTYKRASYSSTRDERRDEKRGRDGRKKSSPKPFGYDSFMENKNRAGATTRWLEEQEYIENKED